MANPLDRSGVVARCEPWCSLPRISRSWLRQAILFFKELLDSARAISVKPSRAATACPVRGHGAVFSFRNDQRSAALSAAIRLLQTCNIQLLHLKHRFHYSLRSHCILVL